MPCYPKRKSKLEGYCSRAWELERLGSTLKEYGEKLQYFEKINKKKMIFIYLREVSLLTIVLNDPENLYIIIEL